MPEVTRKLGIREAPYYVWRNRYGQMAAAEIRRLWQLEEENYKLKQLVADLTLDKVILPEVLAKKPEADPQLRARAGRSRLIPDEPGAGVWAAPIESRLLALTAPWADDMAIRMRVRELAQARSRSGYLRLYVMLRRDGWVVEQEARVSALSGRRAHGTAAPKT